MAKAKSQKSKPTGKRLTSSAHGLLKTAWQFLRAHRRPLLGVIIVALVVNQALDFITADEITAVYQSLWFAFLTAALVWSIRHAQAKPTPTLGQAYWVGSAPTLKLLVVLSLLAIVMAPFAVGAFLFEAINFLSAGSIAADALAAGFWLLLGFLSLVFLARLSLAIIIATLPNLTPFTAIKLSWRLTRKQTLRVSRRLLIFLIYSFGLVLGLLLALSPLKLSAGWQSLSLEILTLGLILPLFYIYLFQIYEELT